MNEKKENVIVNGFFWRFAERCGVQLISAVVSILLARILTPVSYTHLMGPGRCGHSQQLLRLYHPQPAGKTHQQRIHRDDR